MRYDVRCEKCKGEFEIKKRVHDPLPRCETCGGGLRRLFTSAPPVAYKTGGFYATDVQYLKSQVGAERFAKFERQKDDILRRAKQGKLTPYEKSLDAPLRLPPQATG